MFQTELGTVLPTIDSQNYLNLLEKLEKLTGIYSQQIEEAASFSMAMVLRVALGLDAKDAKVAILINESLSSAIALASARHLKNAGCEVKIIFVAEPPIDINLEAIVYKQQLIFHDYTQTECFIWNTTEQNQDFKELLEEQHAVLVGLFHLKDFAPSDFQNSLVNLLNESKVPCHTIFAPLGFDWKTGEKNGARLIASSSLSVGLPLEILKKLPDFIGRHYLCDISITPSLANQVGVTLPILFSEQPIIQIFPPKS